MEDADDVVATPQAGYLQITAELVSAYASNNSLPHADLPSLITQVHAALTALGPQTISPGSPVDKPTPAQIKKSITPDALISFIDGKPYKTLKRHLSTHGLDFETYRARYGLPTDYPTVSANYSAARSALAKDLGLGQQRRKPVALAAETVGSGRKWDSGISKRLAVRPDARDTASRTKGPGVKPPPGSKQ